VPVMFKNATSSHQPHVTLSGFKPIHISTAIMNDGPVRGGKLNGSGTIRTILIFKGIEVERVISGIYLP